MTTIEINYPSIKTYFINYNNEIEAVYGEVLPTQCMSTGMKFSFQTTSLEELIEKLKIDFNIEYTNNILEDVEPSGFMNNDPGDISIK